VVYKSTDTNVQWKVLNTRDYGIPQNRERVLSVGGYFLINIKNTINIPMRDDIYKILTEKLTFVCNETLYVHKRPSKKLNLNTDESIMVFKKTSFFYVIINDSISPTNKKSLQKTS
jgi:site-specific DNA-cytosine methylase